MASVARVLASDYPVARADRRRRRLEGRDQRAGRVALRRRSARPAADHDQWRQGQRAQPRAGRRRPASIVIALDADTQFQPDTIAKLVRWFADPRIGAVAGNARVGNNVNLVTRWQAIEYITSQNVERRALDSLGAITVVPGAVGRLAARGARSGGGYPEDTLAEDQDLTIAIQRGGWRVAYDVEAIAFTEAPETLRALGKQRYRWSFGTLQCLWKHHAVLRTGRPRGLAWFGMPQAWLFQIVFAALSPIIDLALVLSIAGTILRVHQHGWAQTQSDVLRMLRLLDRFRRDRPSGRLGRLSSRAGPAAFPRAADGHAALRLPPADVRRGATIDPLGAAWQAGRLGQAGAYRYGGRGGSGVNRRKSISAADGGWQPVEQAAAVDRFVEFDSGLIALAPRDLAGKRQQAGDVDRYIVARDQLSGVRSMRPPRRCSSRWRARFPSRRRSSLPGVSAARADGRGGSASQEYGEPHGRNSRLSQM